MRGKEVAKPFFHDCVKKMRNGTKLYKGFKAWELNLLGGFKFLLMVILIPRKKNGFDPEFEEIFKAYNDWGGCPFKGYDSKINLVSTVKKNTNLFKVLLNKYGIFIFREKMNIEIESTMNDKISTDDEATIFSGEIPCPTSSYFKYDSDIIEEVSEKIIEKFILPKLLEEIPVLLVDRIMNVGDFNSDSSGYGSSLTSPSFENSLLSMNSPVNSESFSENDDNQVQENSRLREIGNTRNSTSFQIFPSTFSVGQLVQASHGQFSNEQAMMNASMPELENTSYSSSFENFPSTSSVGQLIQTPQGQFFNEQAMINVSMPVRENTRKSCLQNLSMSSVEKLTQNSQEQFSDEQAMINDLISEKLSDYIPASTIDSYSRNTIQNVVALLPSNCLDHNYSIPDSFIAGNSAGDDRSVACNSTPPYNKFHNTQSSFLNQAQLVDFNGCPDLNGSRVLHFSRLSEGCLGMSPGTEEINLISEKSEKDYQNTVVVLDPQSNQLGNSEISKAPWIDIDQNADQNILHFSKFSKSHSGMQFSAKEDVNTVLENSMADEQHALSNSSPPFAACGNFPSYFVEVPSLAFSGKSDTNILEQSPANLSEKYLDMPCNVNEKDELILGVLKKKDVFQKYFSLTDIPTQKKDQRYPSVADFSSVGFEILEEMETSDSESDLLCNIAQNMDCSTEFVPDPSRLENGSMYYQMFGIPSTDCLNDDMQE